MQATRRCSCPPTPLAPALTRRTAEAASSGASTAALCRASAAAFATCVSALLVAASRAGSRLLLPPLLLPVPDEPAMPDGARSATPPPGGVAPPLALLLLPAAAGNAACAPPAVDSTGCGRSSASQSARAPSSLRLTNHRRCAAARCWSMDGPCRASIARNCCWNKRQVQCAHSPRRHDLQAASARSGLHTGRPRRWPHLQQLRRCLEAAPVLHNCQARGLAVAAQSHQHHDCRRCLVRQPLHRGIVVICKAAAKQHRARSCVSRSADTQRRAITAVPVCQQW